jgi:hypothetical protein
VAIEFGERRILLGGDVLRGTRSPKSGWKGILRLLQRHQRLHQVEALAAVKVAHHGSQGAFEPEAWQLHSDGARAGEPVALIAPFTPSSLPDEPTLAALRAHAPAILITRCGAVTHSRMAHVGWSAGPMDVLSATRAPCVGLSIDASGELRTFVSSTAAGFVYGWPSAEFASRR